MARRDSKSARTAASRTPFPAAPVVGRGPDGAEIGRVDFRDHDQGRRRLALGMLDEVAVPGLGERHVGRLQALAAVDHQDAACRSRPRPRPPPGAAARSRRDSFSTVGG